MIQSDDNEALLKMTGLDVVPQDIEAEYELRAAYLHTAGSGAIGAIGLIDLLRFLGHKPRRLEKDSSLTDWEKLPQDGSTLVECGPFFGSMQQGRFKGFVHNGTLAIELDSGEVRECRPQMVKLRDKVGVDKPNNGKPVLIQQGKDLKEAVLIRKEGDLAIVEVDGHELTVEADQVLEV